VGRRGQIAVVAALIALCPLPPAVAAPKRLSTETARVDVASTKGSGVFGNWRVDQFGLPSYRYTADEETDARTAQPELNGRHDAWHQVGNGRAIANVFNHGYTQLWSQDRHYQWANLWQPDRLHFAGGYGYVNVDGQTTSTLYDDRPKGATTERDFGIGYARHRTVAGPVDVTEHVYAPWGDDPVILHDVTITNTATTAKQVTWFEYWDVNPQIQMPTRVPVATGVPAWDESNRTLSVAQEPSGTDTQPLSIFAAALDGPVDGHSTSTAEFFGSGTRAAPAAVAANALPGLVPGTSGTTLFAFRAPVELKPGRSVTLRYAYGMAQPGQITGLVARQRAASLAKTTAQWARWLPQVDVGAKRDWLSRELQWDAYALRSGETSEDCRGHRVLSQGGYYQYGFGFQGAFRDPLQHVLPMIYAQPSIARETLLYSASEQLRGGLIPYGMGELCKRFDLGYSNDMDLWLLWTAAEYGLATRDLALFDVKAPFADAPEATMWEHLKQAFRTQESQLGPHGGYTSGATGDWSDFSTQFLQMTESTLVSAQLAYVYPRIAELADARGDRAFAAELRRAGARNLKTTRAEWVERGWYSRGYSTDRQIGSGAIFGEPQPWAILAGAPSRKQAATVVANIRRYLTGVGSPHGKTKIGSAQSPARDDPGITEHSSPEPTLGSNTAVFVGGAWYAVNGWLTWALGSLDGVVPHATEYAWDELERNTLAAHATAYPDHWNGIASVDDACRANYSDKPEVCGVGLSTAYAGWIMHQPGWSLFDTIRLAGIEPTATGYRIVPHVPFKTFSVRLPEAGVAYSKRLARGYVTTARAARLTMVVRPPAGTGRLTAHAGGRRVALKKRAGGLVEFTLKTRAGRAADWALVRIR
jgi:hypothetical protein